jgi:hypothetical protein
VVAVCLRSQAPPSARLPLSCAGPVLRQRVHANVDTKTDEITGFQPLLEGLDLAGPCTATAGAPSRSTRSPTCTPPRPAPPTWPTGSAVIGPSRRCTTSATPPSPSTPPRSARQRPQGHGQPPQPSPSASCGGTATATSLPRCAATPATPPGSCPCWASPARETDQPALAETLAGTPDSHGPLVGRMGQVAASTNRAIVQHQQVCRLSWRDLSISRLPACLIGDHPQQGGNHAVRAADLPRHQSHHTAPGA